MELKIDDNDNTYTLERKVLQARRLLLECKEYKRHKEYGEVSQYLHELKQKIRSRKAKISTIIYKYKFRNTVWIFCSEAELLSLSGEQLNATYTEIVH